MTNGSFRFRIMLKLAKRRDTLRPGSGMVRAQLYVVVHPYVKCGSVCNKRSACLKGLRLGPAAAPVDVKNAAQDLSHANRYLTSMGDGK